MYKYSAKFNAFYLSENEGVYRDSGTWPDDATEIEIEVAEEFMKSPPEGKHRVSGDNGMPSWADIPTPTHDELVAAASTEKQNRIDQANAYMNSKQWPGKAAIGRLKGDELAQYNLWLDYLDALEVVDTSSAPDIKWPTPPGKQAS
ncbi:TPA: tail fiber assembly protein [Citrobacter freundii]|nr:tail fiber assembly protein [Citrobacter freundii]HCJ7777821.1 tail fiber assembly protein [Citrobacter freundii]